MKRRSLLLSASGWLLAATTPAVAQTVKVTPLGGIDGEFCQQDRALILEDPNGTRVLYDPGRTVAGARDPRLGKVGSEMPPFFAAKLKAKGGDPANSVLARFGGSVTIGVVSIATVTALHSNGVDPDFIGASSASR